MPHVIIRYASKPWDRGEPLTRMVDVPSGYTEAQAKSWLREKLLIKAGESIVSFHPLPNSLLDGSNPPNWKGKS